MVLYGVVFYWIVQCFSMVYFGENRHSRYDRIIPILVKFLTFLSRLSTASSIPLYYIISRTTKRAIH
jgi:hypothetical protein